MLTARLGRREGRDGSDAVTPTTSAELPLRPHSCYIAGVGGPRAHRPSSLSPADELLALLDGRRLSPAQRRIAHYLLENLPEVAFLSSMELAERVGVSQPSVTRFAAALGFSGYPELRAALRPIALGVPETGINGERAAGNELHSALESDQANLEALHKYAADPARLARLGSDLAGSEPLSVIGLRMSAPVASYFAYGAARIHPDVRVIDTPGSPAHEALLQAVAAGGTWLVAFVLPRYPAESVVVSPECARAWAEDRRDHRRSAGSVRSIWRTSFCRSASGRGRCSTRTRRRWRSPRSFSRRSPTRLRSGRRSVWKRTKRSRRPAASTST